MGDDDFERCGACGFDGSGYDDDGLLAAIGGLGARWREALGRAGSDVAIRPEASTWSALEYAAHSRDVTALHVFGVEQALTGAEPTFPEIDGADLIDSAASACAEEDPGVVVGRLAREAERLRDLRP